MTFSWYDAFNRTMHTQSSLTFEKASVMFQIAAIHSSIASSQNRVDIQSLTRAFYYFRACAGILIYINEAFLYPPSQDLRPDIIKCLAELSLAQATEVFLERCHITNESEGLLSRLSAQISSMYNSLQADVTRLASEGVFDKSWANIVQVRFPYVQPSAY